VAFLLDRLREMRIEVQTIGRGEVIQLADLGLEVLHPEPDDRFRRDNDASLVLRIRPTSLEDGPVVLLTGDIEREAMRLLEAREGASLRADIVEVPHHGSARAFAYPFVEGLGPRVLIQSTGPSRLLDERWDLVREGREWYTTASDGAITVIIRRDGTVQTRTFR
jgi:competence protein ComEC